jgi:hypothetical protein
MATPYPAIPRLKQVVMGVPLDKQAAFKTPPSFLSQVKSFYGASKKFIGAGMLIATEEDVKKRLDICSTCEWWDSAALNKTGRCKKCGCSTWAKLRMATEQCPIGKWKRVSDTPTDQKSTPEQEPTKQ